MRPILSATGTYNFNLAKWLEEKLKPLSVNEYTITDVFEFADEIRSSPMNDGRHTGLLWRHSPFYQCTIKWDY